MQRGPLGPCSIDIGLAGEAVLMPALRQFEHIALRRNLIRGDFAQHLCGAQLKVGLGHLRFERNQEIVARFDRRQAGSVGSFDGALTCSRS